MGDVSKDSRQTESVLLPLTLRLFTQNTLSQIQTVSCVSVCLCIVCVCVYIYMVDGKNSACVCLMLLERDMGEEKGVGKRVDVCV